MPLLHQLNEQQPTPMALSLADFPDCCLIDFLIFIPFPGGPMVVFEVIGRLLVAVFPSLHDRGQAKNGWASLRPTRGLPSTVLASSPWCG